MMPADVTSLLKGPPSINKAIDAMALTRVRVSEIGSVLLSLAPQFAVKSARMIEEAANNARNKAVVVAIISPLQARIQQALANAEQNSVAPKLASDADYGATGEGMVTWGSLGDIEFDIIDSPTAFSGKDEVAYAQHQVIGDKPVLQFTGSKLQTLTLEVGWDARLTPDCQDKYDALREAMYARTVMPLIVGQGSIGSMYAETFVITAISHTVNKYDWRGGVLSMKATLSLLEWKENPALVTTEAKGKAVTKQEKKSPTQDAQVHMDKSGEWRDKKTGQVKG